MSKFSDRLISLRKELGLTQEALSAAIHKKRSTYSGYETEGKEPDIETICLFAKYFGVTTDYLLGFSNERTNTERVFYNDNVNFERHFNEMPERLRPVVAKCFDSFYLLLDRDMRLGRDERLGLYQELFQTLQRLRADIRNRINAVGGSVADPVALSDLVALQSQLKNEVSSLLDQLMQADMEIAFNLKQDAPGSSSGSAM